LFGFIFSMCFYTRLWKKTHIQLTAGIHFLLLKNVSIFR
jgi:hypothetical protein